MSSRDIENHIDELKKYLMVNDFEFTRRKVKDYDKSGARVSVPKAWTDVLIVRIIPDRVVNLDLVIEYLDTVVKSCERMRVVGKTTPGLLCGKVDFEQTGRDNPMCKRCPFGKKIAELTMLVNKFYENVEDTELINQLSKRFDYRGPTDE